MTAPQPAAPAAAPVTTTKPTENTMTNKPTIKKRQTTHVEFFQICEWIKNAELGGVFTLAQCAQQACQLLGQDLRAVALARVVRAVGELHAGGLDGGVDGAVRDGKSKGGRRLLRALGKEPSADLMSIINRTGG